MKTFNESDYAQIDAYLHNQLSLEEKQAVERRLHTEADFAAEVNWMRTFMSGYQQLRTRETVEEINLLFREQAKSEMTVPVASKNEDWVAPVLAETPTSRRPFPFSWVAAAAVAIALLSIGVWLFSGGNQDEKTVAKVDSQPKTSAPNPSAIKPSTPDKPTELVQPTVTTLTKESVAYLNKAPKVPGTVPSELNSAVSALNANRPDAALRLLRGAQLAKAPAVESASADSAEEQLFGADPTTSSTPEATDSQRFTTYRQFYTGLSYLRKGQPNRALRVFGTVEAPLRDAADWYSALSYLQLKQSKSGKRLLTQIATNPKHPYYADAKALLNRTEN